MKPRGLEAMIADGRFREDLLYRLKGMILRTPALADRREDIPVLAAMFLRRAMPKKQVGLTPDAIAWLAAQPWPGNVRELQSLLECAAALAAPVLETEALVDQSLLTFALGDA